MLVTRVVASRHFAKAGQLRELLLYVSKKAITAPTEDITEQELGSRALGRRQDYDPQEDTIVRVQMRHLRERLDRYFAEDGRDEPAVMSIPKGSYVPRFEARPGVPGSAPALVAASPTYSWWRLSAILLGICAAVAAAFLLGRSSTSWTQPDASRAGQPGSAFWSRLFSTEQPTSIVIADSGYVVVQDLLQLNTTLDDYLARSYAKLIEAVPEPGLKTALRRVSSRQYTSLADATLASRFYAIGRRAGSRVAVRYARHLNIRDLNTGNFILVGSRRGIPWVELFEPRLNFQLQLTGGEAGFRNKRPTAGEPELYWSRPVDGPYETFATVALLPNLSGSGTVLLLNGITMEASEAAGEFVLRDTFAQTVARLTGKDTGEPGSYFEVLLKIGTIAGAPSKVEVVACRKPQI